MHLPKVIHGKEDDALLAFKHLRREGWGSTIMQGDDAAGNIELGFLIELVVLIQV